MTVIDANEARNLTENSIARKRNRFINEIYETIQEHASAGMSKCIMGYMNTKLTPFLMGKELNIHGQELVEKLSNLGYSAVLKTDEHLFHYLEISWERKIVK